MPAVNDSRIVFAVTHCHPTRIVLYAAAFQGGWKIIFFNSLHDAIAAARTRKPKAVFYEHTAFSAPWDGDCAALAAQHIPFILLGHKTSDETFLVLIASGGYYACGSPLTSEDIVKAVDLAEELTALASAAK